jgi:hypothetical protein
MTSRPASTGTELSEVERLTTGAAFDLPQAATRTDIDPGGPRQHVDGT